MKNVIAIVLFLGLFSHLPAHANAPQVEFSTNVGSFVVELYPDRAPKTVENFLQYVNSGHYQGTIFHRVIEKFVVQGGGLTTDLQHKPTLPPIPNEANNGLKNERGTLAMARALKPDTAAAQFFINVENNKTLNYYRPEPALMGYCVFGRVIRGMDVVDKISRIPTERIGKITDLPREQIVIERVALLDMPVQAEAPAGTQAQTAPVQSTAPKKKGKTRG
jgi:cyclophilin family peptidyl-prolyl cis-trans isomerase